MSHLSWKTILGRRLPVLGHRNWIGIVDSAYPCQASSGIETVATGVAHLTVLKAVLDAVAAAPHVRPLALLDAELEAMPDKLAPGIGALRKRMLDQLRDCEIETLPHDDIIARLDNTASRFNVLILKTSATLPYTSVFLELECGYWSAQAEQTLREKLPKSK